MMKKSKRAFLVLVAVFVAAGFVASSVHAAELKVGYIDKANVYAEYKKAIEYREEIGKMADQMDKSRLEKNNIIKQMMNKAELLDENAMAKKKVEIYEKRDEFRAELAAEQDKFFGKEREMRAEIESDISVVAKELGGKGKYDFIFDSLVFLYNKESFDIT
ncbi:MAG: OmpH family outer membrane protein, partial [Candidatus Omnitrophota bacterium]